MAIINTGGLERAGLGPDVITAYRNEVASAWAHFEQEYPAWTAKVMTLWLDLKGPGDRDTVSVAVGVDAKYGRVEGKTPAELGARLLGHCRERLRE